MAGKRSAQELVVSATTQFTQSMRRVTLQGEDLAGFPEDAEGEYFKFVFTGDNTDKPILRPYTVAGY